MSKFEFLENIVVDNFFNNYSSIVRLMMDEQYKLGYNFPKKLVEDYLNKYRKKANIQKMVLLKLAEYLKDNKTSNSNIDVYLPEKYYNKYLSKFNNDEACLKFVFNSHKITLYKDIQFNIQLNKNINGTLINKFDGVMATQNTNSIEAIDSNITYKVQKAKNNNVLVIADLHLPFTHTKYFEFCKYLKKKYDTDHIVFIGDLIDNHYHSFHDTDPDGLSAFSELDLARKELKKWYNEFPEAIVTNGNHDKLVDRKAYSSGISKEWIKNMKEVLQTPNWEYVDEYIHNNVMYFHGYAFGVSAAYDKALYTGMSVVQGHAHSQCSIQYVNQNTFGMIVGCGVDSSKYAFNYAAGFKKPFIISAAVVLNGTPIIETLK